MNTVKTSFRCTPNLGRKISAHNSKILKSFNQEEETTKPCKCTKEECPVGGECNQKAVIYNATVERTDGVTDTYIGLTENTFKVRYKNHTSNFKTRNPDNSSCLSKYIWRLQDQNIGYKVTWKIISKAQPFNPVTGICNLCIREKYFILFKPEMATINARDEVAGPCRHKKMKLLIKS